MSTVRVTATVIHQEPIGTGIYSMQVKGRSDCSTGEGRAVCGSV